MKTLISEKEAQPSRWTEPTLLGAVKNIVSAMNPEDEVGRTSCSQIKISHLRPAICGITFIVEIGIKGTKKSSDQLTAFLLENGKSHVCFFSDRPGLRQLSIEYPWSSLDILGRTTRARLNRQLRRAREVYLKAVMQTRVYPALSGASGAAPVVPESRVVCSEERFRPLKESRIDIVLAISVPEDATEYDRLLSQSDVQFRAVKMDGCLDGRVPFFSL